IRNRITKELAREGDYTSDDIAQRENMKLTRSAFEMLVFFDQDKLDRNKIIGIAEIPEIGMDLNSPAYKLLALNVKASVDAYWAGLIKSHIEGEYKVLRTAAKERVQRIYGKGLSGDMLGRAADQIIAKNLLRLQHIEVDGKVTEKVVEAGFETASPEVINAEITAKIKAIVENLLREEKALKWGDPISFLRSMALVGAVFAALGFRAIARAIERIIERFAKKAAQAALSGQPAPPGAPPAKPAISATVAAKAKSPSPGTTEPRVIFNVVMFLVKLGISGAVLWIFNDVTKFQLLFTMSSALLIAATAISLVLLYTVSFKAINIKGITGTLIKMLSAAALMYYSGAFTYFAVNNVIVAMVATGLVYISASSAVNLVVSFSKFSVFSIQGWLTKDKVLRREVRNEFMGTLFSSGVLAVGIGLTYIYGIHTMSWASSVPALVALAIAFYTYCNYNCVALITTAAMGYVAGLVCSLFTKRSVFDLPKNPVIDKTDRIPRKYRTFLFSLGPQLTQADMRLTYGALLRSFLTNIKMLEAKEGPYDYKSSDGKKYRFDPEDNIGAILHSYVFGAMYAEDLKQLLDARRKYGRDRIIYFHPNGQDGVSHPKGQMTKPGAYRRDFEYFMDGWTHPHLYVQRTDDARDMFSITLNRDGHFAIGALAKPYTYGIDPKTGEAKVIDRDGKEQVYKRGEFVRDYKYDKKEKGFYLVNDYVIPLGSNKFARERRFMTIEGQKKEVSFDSELYYIDTENPSQRYRMLQGDLYDDRTGQLVATKDMYEEDRFGYLHNRRSAGKEIHIMGLNGKPLPRRVSTVYEQFVYEKDVDGNVARTFQLTKDGKLINITTPGKVVMTIDDLQETKGKNFSKEFEVKYTVYKSDENGVLQATGEELPRIAVDQSRDGRQFEVQRNNYISLELLKKFVDKVDSKGYLTKASGNTQRIANDKEWYIYQDTGDAIANDGQILAKHGTWRRDEDGALYVGGITEEEARVYSQEGCIADIFDLGIGKTGREAVYFVPDAEHSLTRDESGNLVQDPSSLRLREVEGGYLANEKDGFLVSKDDAGIERLLQYPVDGSVIRYDNDPIAKFPSVRRVIQDNVVIDHETGSLIQWQRLAKHDTYEITGHDINDDDAYGERKLFDIYGERKIFANYNDVYQEHDPEDEKSYFVKKNDSKARIESGRAVLDEDNQLRIKGDTGRNIPLEATFGKGAVTIDSKSGDLIISRTLAEKHEFSIDKEGYAEYQKDAKTLKVRVGTFVMQDGAIVRDRLRHEVEPDV
ncbi:MAG: hypothetical protein KKE81_03760, partial [Candidatus Omnitrophica bacterium]|nr:hypothetical protein [Candidatus Omnitrophota bacterium]